MSARFGTVLARFRFYRSTRIEESENARGDKSKYTDKQERKAEHIAEGYEKRACPRRKPSAGLGRR
jgi:hypothetical protein